MLNQFTIKKTARAAGEDQAELYRRGLGHVRDLARSVWSDHNRHDPGITQLELLTYALTELGYRAGFPIEDLLASEGGPAGLRAQFPSAREILPNRPLTLLDYRKLLVDLKGVQNAWLVPSPIGCFADTVDAKLLAAHSGQPGIRPVEIRGVYDVLVELTNDITTQPERQDVLDAVRRTLHGNRNLCEDFNPPRLVEQEPFVLCAELELEPAADLVETHAQLLFRAQQYLAPSVASYSLEERMAHTHPDGSPLTVEEIFEGPALEHGFIDDQELLASSLRAELRLSDLIGSMMDVPGVRAVRDAVLMPLEAVIEQAPLANKWVVPVPAGKQPVLAVESSKLVLYKRGMPLTAPVAAVRARYDALRAEARAKVETTRLPDRPFPTGHYRAPQVYQSVQAHFPEVYGLSDVGLPAGASSKRHAQALQLKAYLLFFDQIMASYFAQLAGVRRLFSTDPAETETYFHAPVTTFRDHARVYAIDEAEVGVRLSAADDALGEPTVARRNRFLDHLIARYAERFHDYAAITHTLFGASPAQLARVKAEFLRGYPRTSAERGVAYDRTRSEPEQLWNTDNVSGYERRVASLLGIANPTRRNLSEVAHDVYAEIDTTPDDELRFRVRHRVTQKIILSSSTHYATAELARAEMHRALGFAQQASGYERKLASDGRFYFNVVDDSGAVLARRIEYFATEALMSAAIEELIAYVRAHYSDEGLYVIEHILLRPEVPGEVFLPICVDPSCTECFEDDPYSYRMHVILPAYASRFASMDFRRFAEEVLREEAPAHVLPKICWIGQDDMARLEGAYRDFLEVKSGASSVDRAQKQAALIEVLYSVKNVYPPERLHDCDAGEAQRKFILGQSALGNHDHDEG